MEKSKNEVMEMKDIKASIAKTVQEIVESLKNFSESDARKVVKAVSFIMDCDK